MEELKEQEGYFTELNHYSSGIKSVKVLVTIPPSTIDVRAPFLVFTTFFVMNVCIKL